MYKNIIKYTILLFCLITLISSYFFYTNEDDAQVIAQGITKEKLVALTVDDGPDPKFTPEILKICQKYGVKATFFVVGEQIEKHPDIFKLEIEAGNEIGNHSYTHRNLNELTDYEIKYEMEKTNNLIYKYSGKKVLWFRPPRRQYDQRVLKEARRQGMETILWTAVVETKKTQVPQEMAQLVISQIKPGGIILLHDSRLDRTSTVKALPLIIEGLQKRGYTFVTLSELFGVEKI